MTSRICWQYYEAGSTCFSFILLVACCLLAQAFFNGSDYWLTLWTKNEQNLSYRNDSRNNTERLYSTPRITMNYTTYFNLDNWLENLDLYNGIYVYTALICGVFAFSLIRAIQFLFACTQSSINLHNRMLQSIIRAPLLFFDRNPVGRLTIVGLLYT